MKTVIMAGGKGTRLASITGDIPKPMVNLCGKPILEYQLECLRENGLSEIIIVTGYQGEVIRNYFGDGSAFGCCISYYNETVPLGSGGALCRIFHDLGDDFILLNGDVIFNVDFSRIIAFHQDKKALVTLAAHPNNHPYDSALLVTNNDNLVVSWLNKEDSRLYYKNQVNAGIHILSRKIFSDFSPQKEKIDLDRDILKPLVPAGTIYAYQTPEYIKDMGTPERYAQVLSDMENGLVARKNLRIKQKAVFLDRDGTINRSNGFISKPEDLVLLDGAAEGIREINRLGYLAIIITNQPVIARGETTLDELTIIHNKLETDLGNYGAYVDDIFFCPHHKDKGFPGERPEYKIDCSCRKPKPGMILKAAEKYNVDLGVSFMVGDDKRDVGAAIAAGCRPIFLGSQSAAQSLENKNIQFFSDLAQFAQFLISYEDTAKVNAAFSL